MVAMHTLRGRISSKLKVDTHTQRLCQETDTSRLSGEESRVEEGGRSSAGGGREGGWESLGVCVVCWDQSG